MTAQFYFEEALMNATLQTGTIETISELPPIQITDIPFNSEICKQVFTPNFAMPASRQIQLQMLFLQLFDLSSISPENDIFLKQYYERNPPERVKVLLRSALKIKENRFHHFKAVKIKELYTRFSSYFDKTLRFDAEDIENSLRELKSKISNTKLPEKIDFIELFINNNAPYFLAEAGFLDEKSGIFLERLFQKPHRVIRKFFNYYFSSSYAESAVSAIENYLKVQDIHPLLIDYFCLNSFNKSKKDRVHIFHNIINSYRPQLTQFYYSLFGVPVPTSIKSEMQFLERQIPQFYPSDIPSGLLDRIRSLPTHRAWYALKNSKGGNQAVINEGRKYFLKSFLENPLKALGFTTNEIPKWTHWDIQLEGLVIDILNHSQKDPVANYLLISMPTPLPKSIQNILKTWVEAFVPITWFTQIFQLLPTNAFTGEEYKKLMDAAPSLEHFNVVKNKDCSSQNFPSDSRQDRAIKMLHSIRKRQSLSLTRSIASDWKVVLENIAEDELHQLVDDRIPSEVLREVCNRRGEIFKAKLPTILQSQLNDSPSGMNCIQFLIPILLMPQDHAPNSLAD